ncbi:hypothetical protein NA56DRAFT_495544 [Hyaloscypha hepaticicola]|uniref:Uncharacterized protein n=1 Tax=Hyaloscypha hepaticicola TaxID=2082293 RepID=A0A2J6QEJ5_9HELO|nr:hypothetical protein NA56DRAFT_495544 [Hyaloscypha hepaticicola]
MLHRIWREPSVQFVLEDWKAFLPSRVTLPSSLCPLFPRFLPSCVPSEPFQPTFLPVLHSIYIPPAFLLVLPPNYIPSISFPLFLPARVLPPRIPNSRSGYRARDQNSSPPRPPLQAFGYFASSFLIATQLFISYESSCGGNHNNYTNFIIARPPRACTGRKASSSLLTLSSAIHYLE